MNFVIHFLSVILIPFAAVTSGFKPPQFSSRYYIEGTFYRPLRDWEAQFRAYYNLQRKQSRIDYNDGTESWIRTYQNANRGGLLLKRTVASDAIRKIYNFPICFQMTDIDYIQDVLPSTNGYNFEKTVEFNGQTSDVLVNNFTLPPLQFFDRYWVNWEDDAKTKPIPLRFERITYNIGTNTTNYAYGTDRWLIDYHVYKPRLFEPTFPRREAGEKCKEVNKDASILSPLGNFMNQVEFKHKSGSRSRSSSSSSGDRSSRRDHDSICHNKDDKTGYQLHENVMGVRFNWQVEKGASVFEFEDHRDLPDQLDLRSNGGIFPVEDQQYCKASYAFVAAGIVEGVHYQRTGVLLGLSRQALVDASFDYENDEGNQGCNGGSIGYSLQWIKKMSGLPLAGDYKRYMALEGTANLSNIKFVAPISEFHKIKNGSVHDIKKVLVEHGPVGSIINNARATSFLFYAGGIYNDTQCNDNSSTDAMQSILIVGYGNDNGKEYWIVKNSWSPYWGIDGYIYISIEGNICGILDNAWGAVSAIK